jgi:hypothetical protein
LLWLCAAVAACHGRKGDGGLRTEAADDDLVALLPVEAQAVMEVNVARLRGWRGLQSVLQVAPEAQQTIGRLARRLGFDPLLDLDQLAIATYQLGELPGDGAAPLQLVAAIRGRFPAGSLSFEKVAATPGGGGGKRVQTSERRGIPIVDVGAHSMARLTPRTLLYGTPASVRAAVDCAFGARASARANGPLMRLLAQVRTVGSGDEPALVHAGRLGSSAQQLVAPVLGEEVAAEQLWVRLDLEGSRPGGQGQAGQGMGLFAGVAAGSPDKARAASRRLSRQTLEVSQGAAARLFGLSEYVRPLEVAAVGSELRATYVLDSRQVEDLIGRLGMVARILMTK